MIKVNVNKIWYDHIKQGSKTVEGRLDKGKFSKFTIGQEFYFINERNKIKVKITNIIKYKTFKQYLEMEGLKRTLPGINSISDGINVYYSFYTKEMETHYGILAIEVKLI